MRTLLSSALVALLWSIPAPVAAGVIHGTLRVPPLPAPSAGGTDAYPGTAGSMAGAHQVRHGLVTDAVIYVDHVPAAAESALAAAAASAAPPRLAQKGQMFVPRVIAIAVNTNVEFPNLDPIFHNVFSLSPPRRFDLGKYPRGQSKAVAFNKAGLVNVFCDIHSEMAAYILVLPHHAFVQPRADGAFDLPDLPAGRYELHVWHPDLNEIVRTVEVPAHGDVRVDLGY